MSAPVNSGNNQTINNLGVSFIDTTFNFINNTQLLPSCSKMYLTVFNQDRSTKFLDKVKTGKIFNPNTTTVEKVASIAQVLFACAIASSFAYMALGAVGCFAGMATLNLTGHVVSVGIYNGACMALKGFAAYILSSVCFSMLDKNSRTTSSGS